MATKVFNTEGVCIPEWHYMVDMSAKVEAIVDGYIARGAYFTINRGRQYGKTTTLRLLAGRLRELGYTPVSLTFESSDDLFASRWAFATGFGRLIAAEVRRTHPEQAALLVQPVDRDFPFEDLSERVTALCAADRRVVLMVDEVDKAASYDVFSSFLSLLRAKYLKRMDPGAETFHSVILVGVSDIRNIRRRIRPDSEHTYNSPWNIAAPFGVELGFDVADIVSMLAEYEADHATGMDIAAVAQRLFHYTNGYPYLTTRLCQLLDERSVVWDPTGVDEIANVVVREHNTLFDDLVKNLDNHPSFARLVKEILLQGADTSFDINNPEIGLGAMFGILAAQGGKTRMANRIFESVILSYFVSVAETRSLVEEKLAGANRFIIDGYLDMKAALEGFAEFMHAEYRDEDGVFIETHARLLLLSWLKPIINGGGTYFVESEVRADRRIDLAVYYNREEHILELKIWRGEKANDQALDQLVGYLDAHGHHRGYLVSFTNRLTRPHENRTIDYRGHEIVEVVIAYRDRE